MPDLLWDLFLDSLADAAKTLPFLFGAYLLMEFLEHRAGEKFTRALSRLGPWGPVGGAVLGCVPQCGFSVAAANFYAGRLITPGTLVAVFLATSDEAVPILLSQPGALPDLARLLGVKLAAGAAVGLLVDLAARRLAPARQEEPMKDLCRHCGCEHHGLVRSALVHTAQIFLFLFAVNLVLGLAIALIGEEALSAFLLSGSVFQPLLTALVGFLPNCAASVLLTQLYLSGSLSFGAAVAGLCTGAGLGLATLWRANPKPRENLLLMAVLYGAAVLVGVLCSLLFPG